MLRYLAEQQVNNRSFSEVIRTRPSVRAASLALKKKLGPQIQQLLDRAKEAGLVRADVNAGDIPLLLAGLSERELAPGARQRYLEIVLNGLRPRP